MKNLAPAVLDATDRRILAALQKDCTLSVQDLANLVGMSPSPCWRRVKALRDLGVIRAEVALLDRKRLDMGTLAYVHLSLMDHAEATIRRLEEFVLRHDRVVECATITGSDDYVIKVIARDPEDLERFIMKELLALGVVRSSTTHFVLRQTKYSTAVPLE
jgi:Lrp/AsnC family transcriptional regulator, leucine-responsive regulatory protein